MDKSQYEQLKNVDVRTVDANTLVNIEDVVIHQELPKEERIRDFVEQIRNPYCYKCNGIVVKSVYNDEGGTLEDRLVNLFHALSEII